MIVMVIVMVVMVIMMIVMVIMMVVVVIDMVIMMAAVIVVVMVINVSHAAKRPTKMGCSSSTLTLLLYLAMVIFRFL